MGRPADAESSRLHVDGPATISQRDPLVRQVQRIRAMGRDDEPQRAFLQHFSGTKDVCRVASAFMATGEYRVVIACRNNEDPRHHERPGHAHDFRKVVSEGPVQPLLDISGC